MCHVTMPSVKWVFYGIFTTLEALWYSRLGSISNSYKNITQNISCIFSVDKKIIIKE